MLMPSKHIRQQSSLLYIGGIAAATLVEPMSVSMLWEQTRKRLPDCGFDHFVLALDFLYLLNAVTLGNDGLLTRVEGP